jgi:hypothetical protein
MLILKKAVDLSTRDCLTPSDLKISASHIAFVVRNFEALNNVTSPAVLAKFPGH